MTGTADVTLPATVKLPSSVVAVMVTVPSSMPVTLALACMRLRRCRLLPKVNFLHFKKSNNLHVSVNDDSARR